MARVQHEKTVFRVGPGEDYDRRTPLEKGVLLLITGETGGWLLADLGGGDLGWVEGTDVEWLDKPVAGRPVPAVDNKLRNVLIRRASPGTADASDETYVDLQMTRRTSFDIVETAEPPSLLVRLHRTTLMMHEIAVYAGDRLVRSASLQQPRADVVELRLPLAGRALWGWQAKYGTSPNLASDPPGHDFTRVAKENLRLAIKGPPRRSGRLGGITVVIDPGHGGPDSGAVGVNGLEEKDVNLSVGLALKQELEHRGARVVMTRKVDRAVAADVEHELAARVDIAQTSGGTLFISIHHNARERIEEARIAQGVFIYYYRPQSADLGRMLADPVADAQGARVRAYVWRSFHVIRPPAMPSVLVEAGFISNPEEEQKMRAPDYAKRVAMGLADGVERFLDARLGD